MVKKKQGERPLCGSALKTSTTAGLAKNYLPTLQGKTEEVFGVSHKLDTFS
jgi:hypothetical protein